MMIKKLVKYGDSFAIEIDQSILENLQISDQTPLELTANGDCLTISPLRETEIQDKIADSLNKINQNYGDDLRRLGN